MTARRLTANEAMASGFVEDVAHGDEVLARALDWAGTHATVERHAISDIKAVMYGPTVAVLRGDAPGSRAHRPASAQDRREDVGT